MLKYAIVCCIVSHHRRTKHVQMIGNREHDGLPEHTTGIVSCLASKEIHFITGEFFVAVNRDVADSDRSHRATRRNDLY
jgi:hypothetical protein